MKTEELVNLKPGMSVFYRSRAGLVVDVFETSIIIEIDGWNILPILIEHIDMLFVLTDKNKKLTESFLEDTRMYYSSRFEPKNPEIDHILINYWKNMCEIIEYEYPAKFTDIQYSLRNYVKQLNELITQIELLNVKGTDFFSKLTIDQLMEKKVMQYSEKI